MSKIATPLGARVYVEDDPVVVEEVVRAQEAGLHVVIDKKNIPRPTSGVVIAVGPDPLIQDLIQVGDRVFFSKYCTNYIQIDGHSYHVLELNELTGREREVKPPEATERSGPPQQSQSESQQPEPERQGHSPQPQH